MHGGAGAILSVGLLRRIPLAWFEDCVTTTYTTGGDAMISICLWEAGFAMTAPDPLWHPRSLTMFDVGRSQQLDHEDIQPRIAHIMGNMLQALAGGCRSGLCKVCCRIAQLPALSCFDVACEAGWGLAWSCSTLQEPCQRCTTRFLLLQRRP